MTPDQTSLDLAATIELEEPRSFSPDELEGFRAGYGAPLMRRDVSELEIGDQIAGPYSWTPVVTITAVGEMLWQDPFGRVSRDVWATDNATGEPLRLQIKPGVPIPLVKEG